jgi:hypothetical protein
VCLLSISRIDQKLSAALKKHLDTLRTKLESEIAFDQPIIDEVCYSTAWCRMVLNDATDELDAENKPLAKDVFADRVIADVFNDISGDGRSIPQRMYETIDAVGAAY